VLVGVLSIQSQVFSTVHGSAQGAAMNRWCCCLEYLGEYAEVSQGMSFIVCSAVHRASRVANPGSEKATCEGGELDPCGQICQAD
jgi:hypothetical protein